jgi:tetratricopeptide (TPR) repeat protein
MITANPQDSNLYSYRASAFHRQGKESDALSDYDHAISINPQDAKLHNNRGFIYLGIEKLNEALADFNTATALDPRYINAFNNRGLLFIAQKRYADAITQFNCAIEIDSQYVDAYNNRGFAEYELGKIEQALDDFNQAIKLNSNYVNAFNNRGLLRARAGDYENAVADFTHAMMIDPLNLKYYEHRRDVYRRLGVLDKARADEKKIAWLIEYHQVTAEMTRSVQPVQQLIQRSRLFLQVNDDENAMRDVEQALAIDAQSAEALAVRASVHLQQRLLNEAKMDALASLQIEPSEQAHSILGDVFLKQRNYDQAIENFSLARRVDQDVAKAYFAKAKQLEELGQAEQAKDSLQQAIVLDPDVESRLR